MLSYIKRGVTHLAIKNPRITEWVELYNSGESTAGIAKKFETKPNIVAQALNRRGVKMSKSKFSNVHAEWVERYLAGESMAVIAKDYGTDAANVHFTLRQKGVECRKTPETIKHEELLPYHAEWAKLYEEGMSTNEIARKYGEDSTTVWRAVKTSGVETRKAGEVNRKYFVQNDHVFDVIDTPEKAYWLGFLMADGNVYFKHGYAEAMLQVNLARIDEGHIEKLRTFLGTDSPIRQVDTTNSVHFAVGSTNLTNGLINQGCVPRKSLIIKYPKISDDLQWSFILGYFDGNGSIIKSKDRGLGKKYDARFSISGGSRDFVTGLQISLLQVARLSSVITSTVKNTHKLSVGRKQDIAKLHKWFYANATVYLDRKKLKFDELINNKGF